MTRALDQVLTLAQMRAAEDAVIAGGSSVDQLMQVAGRGAAEWVWRAAAGRPVTVLCGPGNNGGDGYVIAEALRQRGGTVRVVTSAEPGTAAARVARSRFGGALALSDDLPHGGVLVDCLFGSGLSRPLTGADLAVLDVLAKRHDYRIAVDLPSGVDCDSGAVLNPGLPVYELTLALGAWKRAHFLMPAAATMGALKLVDIGIAPAAGAARALGRPKFAQPLADSHKYRRGLLGVVAGAMSGAAVLSCLAAQGAGAGYVKLLDQAEPSGLPDLVVDHQPLGVALSDPRWSALLIGPGLGRDQAATECLSAVIASNQPTVIDADALHLLGAMKLASHSAPLLATPHAGELAAMEAVFGCSGTGSQADRALALAVATGMVIVAKGPDTVVAAPDRQLAFAHRASSWLSVAGTGDVLAGTIASRLACGAEAFAAACEGVWLHAAAARICPPPFSARALAGTIASAYAACL